MERGGKVRAQRVRRVTAKNLGSVVDPTATLITDECAGYRRVGMPYAAHHTVNHSRGEYARGTIHTNTIESFFALLKRGIYGTFHSVSDRHLHKYLWEFEFRYNNRKVDDGERTVRAIQGAAGKRLWRAWLHRKAD